MEIQSRKELWKGIFETGSLLIPKASAVRGNSMVFSEGVLGSCAFQGYLLRMADFQVR